MTSYIYKKFFNPGDQIKSSDELVKHYNDLRLNSSIFSKIFKYSMGGIFKNSKFSILLVTLMFTSLTSINLLEYNTKNTAQMHSKIQNLESLTSTEINELSYKLSEISKIWK